MTGFTSTELYLLHEIVIRLDRLARTEILEPRGILYPEFLVMMAVRELQSPTQEAVRNHIDLSTSLVSQRVSALRKKGLIKQRQNPQNRREVHLSLTDKGNQVLDSAYEAMLSSSEQLFALAEPGRTIFHQRLLEIAEELRTRESGEAA
jgi:DNA-binding MarR family transcriptional regulator